jgi:hypothetical protein
VSEEEVVYLRSRVAELEEKLRAQEGELGWLRATAERVGTLQMEHDQARDQLASLQAALESRIGEEVKSALAQARTEFEAASADWARQRENFERQIQELREAPAAVTGRDVETTELAGHFRAVLDELAMPTVEPGRSFAAAMTGLEVEARGVITPADDPDQPPLIRAVDPTTVESQTLSTVRMTFGLLPRVGEVVLPPTPPAPES